MARQRAYVQRNPEKVIQYRERNREHIAEYQRAYRKRNRKKLAEYKRAYRARRRMQNAVQP